MTKAVVAAVLISLFEIVSSHSWGLSSCTGPIHGPLGALQPGLAGVKIRTSDDKTLHIESETPFLGFLLSGDVSYTNIPGDSEASGICGKANKALSHTSAVMRNSLTVDYVCDPDAEAASVRGYIVFGVHKKHIAFSGMVHCPSPHLVETSTTTALVIPDLE